MSNIPTHASYLADVARAAHQTGKDLTLDDVAAVIEAVNSLGAADDTLARTGNTARDQEMYAAGIRTGEENAKHNAAIRAGVPDGWKLVEALRESLLWTASSLAAVGKEQDLITLEGRKRTIGEILDEANAALNAPSPDCAAPGVSRVEDASFPSGAIVNGRVLADRLEAYPFESQGGDLRLCSDWVEFRRCFEYLAEWVGSRAPAAGDALPSKPGVYAWSAGTSNALVLVDRRPSAHSPGGVLNGHVIESTRFYDGCAVESWGRDGRWTLLHDFAAAIAAQRKGGA